LKSPYESHEGLGEKEEDAKSNDDEQVLAMRKRGIDNNKKGIASRSNVVIALFRN
jgi:hypothetical protein